MGSKQQKINNKYTAVQNFKTIFEMFSIYYFRLFQPINYICHAFESPLKFRFSARFEFHLTITVKIERAVQLKNLMQQWKGIKESDFCQSPSESVISFSNGQMVTD